MKKLLKNFVMVLSILFAITVISYGKKVNIELDEALIFEAIFTVHISVFLIAPIINSTSVLDKKRTFWKIFGIRTALVLFCLLISRSILTLDSLAVFFGAIVTLIMSIEKKSGVTIGKTNLENTTSSVYSTDEKNLKCTKCENNVSSKDKFCHNCGADLSLEGSTTIINEVKKVVTPKDYEKIYSLNDKLMLEHFIDKEIEKAGISKDEKCIPQASLKRKNVLNLIFSVLVFVFISLIFFHFPIYTYLVGILILVIFYFSTRNYSLLKFLVKEVKSRPSEKISNIVMNVKESLVVDNSKKIKLVEIFIAIVLPLIIFMEPRIMYEKNGNGYAVRFYTFGITNLKTATIPENYKGEDVVELRGNCFSNMPFLKSVFLPDTLTSIRGQAFKNDISLKNVKIPSGLEYLGGGAFYNCKKIENVEFPDTLTQIGGETFYGASSLKSVKLPANLEEIRGNTFEECTSLESIQIPDSVKRIGGHAFYNCKNLSSVEIGEDSKLYEIGSSAFRLCSSLKEITLPKDTKFSIKTFKESPTNVKRYDHIMNGKKYKYDSFIYLKAGESDFFERYEKESICFSLNSKIKLESVEKSDDGNKFNLLYEDDNGICQLTLTKKENTVQINENLILKVKDDYVFEMYDDSISLYAYFN